MPDWEKLGSGSYNHAFVNKERTRVLKVPKDESKTDAPERSVRLWNEINPNLPPAELHGETENGALAWTCPYVSGRQANDQEMTEALIRIFNDTGRIITDAVSDKNFITTEDNQTICIDIGMAMLLDKQEETFFNKRARRHSIVSLESWRLLQHDHSKYFAQHSTYAPETINTIKALLFIKANRPDINNVDFLLQNRSLIQKLAFSYDYQACDYPKQQGIDILEIHSPTQEEEQSPTTPDEVVKSEPLPSITISNESASENKENVDEGKNILQQEKPLNLQSTKESCIEVLNRYIQSRGKITVAGEFKPSLTTKLFRNTALSSQKIAIAKELIRTINEADSLDDIQTAISTTKESNLETNTLAGKGLITCLGRCELDVTTAKDNPELIEEPPAVPR